MSAIVKACSINTSVKNTGKECDTAMVATAMLIAIQKSVTLTDTDLLDPVAWLTNLIHLRKAFPLFGANAPIREINNNAESDIIVTLDDGLQVFMRYGIYNRQFGTTSGGLCYAKSLQSFLNSGYSLIEVDQQGQMLARKNNNGTYSGLITDFMYSPTPAMADLRTTPYKNFFKISYSPQELVNNGVIFEGASALLSMSGLIDVVITSAATATTTKLKIAVNTECAGADLVSLFGADLAQVANFIVIHKADGAVVSVSAAAVVSGHIELTGTYVSGQTYTVKGAAPSVWQGNLVQGYDASVSAFGGLDILIP